MGNNSGIAAESFVNSFMRGYGFTEQMRQQREQDAEHQQDRAWQQKQRSQFETEHAQDRDWQQKQRDYATATQAAPEQVKESRDLTLRGQRAGLDLAETKTRAAKGEMDRQAAGRELASATSILSHPELMDESSMDELIQASHKHHIPIEGIVGSQKFADSNSTLLQMTQGAPISHEATVAAFDTRFHKEIRANIGKKLANGDEIVDSSVSNGYLTKDHNWLAVELNITAKRKDGSTYQYKAPVTKNRSGDQNDTVLMIPADKVIDKLIGAHLWMAALDEAPEARDKLLQHFKTRGIAYGADVTAGAAAVATKGARGGAGGSGRPAARVQELEYLASAYGGDKERAIQEVYAKPEAAMARIALKLATEKDQFGKPKYSQDQANKMARSLVTNASRYSEDDTEEQGPAEPAPADESAGGAGLEDAETELNEGQAVDGYTFTGGDPNDQKNWRPAGNMSESPLYAPRK